MIFVLLGGKRSRYQHGSNSKAIKPQQRAHSPQVLPDGSASRAAGSFNLSLAGVSQSVKRGEIIVQHKGYNFIDP